VNFIRQRIIMSIVVFLAALNLDFVLPRLLPGSAAEIFAAGTRLPQNDVQLISERLGLNQPVLVQYYDYLRGIFASWPPYLGVSYQFYPKTVASLIIDRLPWTILLIATSFFLAFMISFLLAARSMFSRGGKFELSSVSSSIIFWATPSFWVGMILIWTFSVSLGWFPISGNASFQSSSGIGYAYSIFIHAILPIATLTLAKFGADYLVLRGSALEASHSDYTIAAKARGLGRTSIVFRYVLRNSLLPVVSLVGYSLGSLVSSVVLVEAVFGYPGVGDLIVDGVLNRDYPVVQGAFLVVTLVVILGTLLGDYLLLRLDPRLRR
jgi:peptide/nickel transport system permease protein